MSILNIVLNVLKRYSWDIYHQMITEISQQWISLPKSYKLRMNAGITRSSTVPSCRLWSVFNSIQALILYDMTRNITHYSNKKWVMELLPNNRSPDDLEIDKTSVVLHTVDKDEFTCYSLLSSLQIEDLGIMEPSKSQNWDLTNSINLLGKPSQICRRQPCQSCECQWWVWRGGLICLPITQEVTCLLETKSKLN